jgi:hypothetical protein
MEAAFDSLHAAADEQRRVVVFGKDVPIANERKTKLLETSLDYIKKAECRIISLSSVSLVLPRCTSSIVPDAGDSGTGLTANGFTEFPRPSPRPEPGQKGIRVRLELTSFPERPAP